MDRVDLVLVSEGIEVKEADILDEELERGRSDHVPIMVEVEAGAVGGGGVEEVDGDGGAEAIRNKQQLLSTSDPAAKASSPPPTAASPPLCHSLRSFSDD